MAYTKPLITTSIDYYDGQQATIEFADAIVDGETVRYGSTVRKQVLNKETIDSIDTDGTHQIIPYHAVVVATVTKTDSEEQTKPEDAFCH